MVTKTGRSLSSTILLIVANLLIPVSILTFAIGFFPHKPFLPGLAEYDNALEYGQPPAAPFDKLVFMVVDALRSDFVYDENSGFKYTQSLIRDGQAIPFTANARSPTVTMPRIKAITTGSIPSFVDLILNFDEEDTSSTLASQDTWLAQIKAQAKGKLLMYGDDTWLKLFPDTFDRTDGTSSFFVADFTEVDHNVTRNIAGELQSQDWSLMVLHYLGLDHIGHKSGPRSPNMIPKQEEMDGIVRTIYHAIETQSHLESTLLVLIGDHGMNDAGNHGASSPGETNPALVFMSPKLKAISKQYTAPATPKGEYLYYSKVEQSDLTPTLAALLGFPISKNNLGAFISEFLPFWPSSSDKVQILVRNARQILNIVTAAFGPELFSESSAVDPCKLEPNDIHNLACQWRKINTQIGSLSPAGDLPPAWFEAISSWLREAQELVSSMASNYDMTRLGLGSGLAVVSFICSLVAAIANGDILEGLATSPLVLVTTLYGVMMFASSYVEEEHHFWYWSSTMFLAVVGTGNIRKTRKLSSVVYAIIVLACLRLIRGWNQTGQKFAGEPDLVKIILAPNPQFLWVLITSTYTIVFVQILTSFDGLPYAIATGFSAVLVTFAFLFKLAFSYEDAPELVIGFAKTLNDAFQGQSLPTRARLVFGTLAIASSYAVYRALTGRSSHAARSSSHLLHHLYTLLALTQSRATNIPLFLVSTVLLAAIPGSVLSPVEISTLSILLQYTTFFALGGSNAISSVDLSSAYNGVSGFNIIAVGVLTFVSNWAGPIFWTSATNLLLLQKWREGRRGVWRAHVTVLTVFATGSLVGVMVACTALRTHLFIWTVFSPKYLYAMAWNLAQHLVVNVVLGGLLFWIGAR